MCGFGHEPRAGDAHRGAAARLGRTGPRDVVALRLRGDPADRRRPSDARGRLRGHHLPDARPGLPRPYGASAAQVDHLVRFAGRRPRRGGPRGDRPRALPEPYAQLAGQLHRLETGLGQAPRGGTLLPHRPLPAAGRLHRLPPLGASVDEHQRPFGADPLGLPGGAPGRFRGRLVRHSARDDPRGRSLDRRSVPDRCRHGAAAGHPGRDPDLVPRRRSAEQCLLAQCAGGGRSGCHGRHERRGLRRDRHAEGRSAVARQYLRSRQPHPPKSRATASCSASTARGS